MPHDLSTREHIDDLMARFYARAMSDPTIGFLFTEVARLDLEHHLPVIGDFWESTLLGTGVYSRHGRNPLLVHADLHGKAPLEASHFQRWLEIFGECVDESFSGARAEYAKTRSHAIAQRMQEFLAVRNE